VRYQAKWRIALEQLLRLHANGVHCDWLTFDEVYGGKVPFPTVLSLAGQRFVAEVPVSFAAQLEGASAVRQASAILTAEDARRGRRYRLRRQTHADAQWRASSWPVWVKGQAYVLVVAINEAMAEVKYFVTNATCAPLARVLQVAFRRATVEHSFRVAKTEAGLAHYEGRQYVGLVRHLLLALIVMAFVSIHTDRLRGKNPRVTMEQVCRALNARCARLFRQRQGTAESCHVGEVIQYHQRRNQQAARSHKKRRHRCIVWTRAVELRPASVIRRRGIPGAFGAG
jgi:SRSO17 transposase